MTIQKGNDLLLTDNTYESYQFTQKISCLINELILTQAQIFHPAAYK